MGPTKSKKKQKKKKKKKKQKKKKKKKKTKKNPKEKGRHSALARPAAEWGLRPRLDRRTKVILNFTHKGGEREGCGPRTSDL